jgi:hypothetical protein
MLTLSSDTMRLVRAKRPPGYVLAGGLPRLDDGLYLLPVADDVVVRIASERVHGESDDAVVSRLLVRSERN